MVDEPQELSPTDVSAIGWLRAHARWALCGTGRLQLRQCAEIVWGKLPHWVASAQQGRALGAHVAPEGLLQGTKVRGASHLSYLPRASPRPDPRPKPEAPPRR